MESNEEEENRPSGIIPLICIRDSLILMTLVPPPSYLKVLHLGDLSHLADKQASVFSSGGKWTLPVSIIDLDQDVARKPREPLVGQTTRQCHQIGGSILSLNKARLLLLFTSSAQGNAHQTPDEQVEESGI